MAESNGGGTGNLPPRAPWADARLYVPNDDGFSAAIKHGWTKEYCFLQNPGENYYHLLLNGEIYLQRGNEKYCLSCSVRHGFVTHERGYWQKGPSSVVEDFPQSEPQPPET
jgi:hypothetical protein